MFHLIFNRHSSRRKASSDTVPIPGWVVVLYFGFIVAGILTAAASLFYQIFVH